MKRLFVPVFLIGLLIMGFSLPSLVSAQSMNENETAYVDVAAATLWTNPDSARSIDQPSLTNPVDLWKWTESMTLNQKEWLIGEIQTQALYGDKVTILQEKGDWVEIAAHGQPNPKNDLGYPGWIPKRQITTNKSFDQKQDDPFALVTTTTAWLYNNRDLTERFMEISMNTRLPIVSQKKDAVEVATPDDGNKWISSDDVSVYNSERDIPKPTGEDLVNTAKEFLGLPYLWAGNSGFGFDCSGFTRTVFQTHGITIPRDTGIGVGDGQSGHGQKIDKEDLLPGDLVFFAYDSGEGNIHHVGMYIGDGNMIHAPNSEAAVRIDSLDESDYWLDKYAGSSRYFTSGATDLQSLVKDYNKAGNIKDSVARALHTHLTAVSSYEKNGDAQKVVKHLKGFKVLLNHQKNMGSLSEKEYETLKDNTNQMLEKWK